MKRVLTLPTTYCIFDTNNEVKQTVCDSTERRCRSNITTDTHSDF